MTPARDPKQHVFLSRPEGSPPDCSPRLLSQGGLQILDSSSLSPDCSPKLLSQGGLQILDSSSLSPDCFPKLLSQGGLQILDSSSQVPGPRGPLGPPLNRSDAGGYQNEPEGTFAKKT